MSISTSLFNIIYNLVPFLTLNMYFNYFFDLKVQNTTYKKIYAGTIIFLIVFSILNLDLPTSFFISLPFLFVEIVFSNNFIKKILHFITFNLLLYIPFGIVYFFFTFLLDSKSLIENSSYQDLKSMMCCLIGFICFSIIFNNKKIKKTTLANPYRFQLYSSLLLIVFSLLVLVCTYISDIFFFSIETAIYLSYFVNIILIVILLSLFNNVVIYLQDSAQKQAQLKEYEMKLTYYNNISDNLKQLRSLRHDFKNHLNIINGRIANGETEKALEYISSIAEISTDLNNLIISKNETLSAILNIKKLECDNLNIDFHHSLDFEKIYNLNDIDLIVILGNILDNSILAASKCSLNNRSIQLSITQVKSYLSIRCINSMAVQPVEKNGKLISTKDNSESHGIGLTNILETVKKYNGEFNYSYTQDQFTIDIFIQNYE